LFGDAIDIRYYNNVCPYYITGSWSLEELPNSEATNYAWKEKELIEIMEKSLPTYVIKCFLNSGYSNTAAIVQMTSEGPQNSLDQIEQFILTYFLSDISCYSPKFVVDQEEKSFKSPPLICISPWPSVLN